MAEYSIHFRHKNIFVMDIEYYERTMGKIYEAKLVNDGLSDIESGKTVDGDTVKIICTDGEISDS